MPKSCYCCCVVGTVVLFDCSDVKHVGAILSMVLLVVVLFDCSDVKHVDASIRVGQFCTSCICMLLAFP